MILVLISCYLAAKEAVSMRKYVGPLLKSSHSHLTKQNSTIVKGVCFYFYTYFFAIAIPLKYSPEISYVRLLYFKGGLRC